MKRKTLYWPAQIVKLSPGSVQVMYFDKDKTMETKKKKDMKPFDESPDICKGKKPEWVKGYKEALEQKTRV